MIRSRAKRVRQREDRRNAWGLHRTIVKSDKQSQAERVFRLGDVESLRCMLKDYGWDNMYLWYAADSGDVEIFEFLLDYVRFENIPLDMTLMCRVCEKLLENGARSHRHNHCLLKWYLAGMIRFEQWMVECARQHQNEDAMVFIESFLLPPGLHS